MHKTFWFAVFVFFGTLLFTPSTVTAQEQIDNFNTYSSLDLIFSLTSGITILPTGGQQKIEYITTDLSFFPQDGPLQTISNLNPAANPQAKIQQDEQYISYTWQKPPIGSLSFNLAANVKTKQDIAKIRKIISFPLKNLDNNVLVYTRPTQFIDLNDAIQEQAYKIIGAETDLYKIVFEIADWTKNNIKYDLNTLTAEVVQKSSWVLQNREGVCDEMTNLFISFLRSVGIPARFVSGMVYTNVDHQWGPHGWAEVYFPGYGWVPFDVTFGQYGWLDPSHLKLKESTDSGSPSAEYSWQASGVEVKPQELQPSVTLKNTGAIFSSPLTITLEPLRQNVGPGSFVPILATVTNTQNYYVSASLNIKKAPELTSNNVKEVFLLPGETKTIGWIASIPGNLDDGYIYTSALEVASAFGDTATGKINYAKDYPIFSQSEATTVISNLEQREDKQPLKTIVISCASQQEMYYSNETALIDCEVTNTDSRQAAIEVCARADCNTLTIEAGAAQETSFTIHLQSSGRIPITAETANGIIATYVTLTFVALPEIYTTNINPASLAYQDDVKLSFDLATDNPVTNVNAHFLFGSLDLGSLQGSRQITIDTNGKSLYLQGLKFTVQFTDEKGEQHTQHLALPIQITHVPWYAKFVRWISGLF